MKPKLYRALSLSLLLGGLPLALTAQETASEPDPFAGNYILGNSAELFLLWGTNENDDSSAYQRLYDVDGFGDGTIPNSIVPKSRRRESGNFGAAGNRGMDVATGDLNGDDFDDVVAAWEGPNGTVKLLIPRIRAAVLSWDQATRTTVAPGGGIRQTNCGSRTRHRLVTANFDNDPQSELLLAYRRPDERVQIAIYDTDGGPTPSLRATAANESVFEAGVGCRAALFDVTAGDLDGDGLDEIALVGVEAASAPPGMQFPDRFVGWRLFVRFYDVVPGTGQSPARIVARGRGITHWTDWNNRDYELRRLAIGAGDLTAPGGLNDDLTDELVIAFQVADSDLPTLGYLLPLKAGWRNDPESGNFRSFDLSQVQMNPGLEPRPNGRVEQERTLGNSGWPLSLVCADLDGDGRDEVLSAMRSQIRVYESDRLMALRSAGAVGYSTQPQDDSHRVFGVADLDAETYQRQGPGWRSELVLVENLSFSDDGGISNDGVLEIRALEIQALEIQAARAAPGQPLSVRFTELATQERVEALDNSSPRPVALALGDFDGNAIRVGEPRYGRRTDINRPLVVLNAPPVHFDVLSEPLCPNGRCDLSRCFPAGAQCQFEAVYERTQSSSFEVTTELNADWTLSTEATLGLAGTIEGLQFGVQEKLSQTYGERFQKAQRYSRTITTTERQGAKVDDQIYAVVTDYDLWEYPVYVNGNQQGQILVVVPRARRNQWFDHKSYSATSYIPNHEIGNVLSYQSINAPNQNAAVAQGVRFRSGDARTLGFFDTPRDWTLTDTGVSATSSTRATSNRIAGTPAGLQVLQEQTGLETPFFGENFPIDVPAVPSFNFAGTGFELTGDYEESTVSVGRSTVVDTRSLTASFGAVNGAIGNTRYTVQPYTYWANNGALVLDYSVEPERAPPGAGATFWDKHYGDRPDPAFNLPWRYDPEKGLALSEPAQRRRTRDITFLPQDPEPGSTVTIVARIHNYSLVPTRGPVAVRFYLGDPGTGGRPIVGTNNLAVVQTTDRSGFPTAIPPRGYAFARIDWQTPANLPGTFVRIYASVDPGRQVAEVHENNNLGWTVLAVNNSFSGAGLDTVGIYAAGNGQFFLRNANSAGRANATVAFGPAHNAGWEPLVGDWNGDGADTIGLYRPGTGTFYLRNANAAGRADLTLRFGPAGNAGWQPLAGDWNGDGIDTIGLYDPARGTFYLRDANRSGPTDVSARFGPAGNAGWTPVTGDWDGDGVDTIGLFNPTLSTFYLRNSNDRGRAQVVVRFGPASVGWGPLGGDWNGDGTDTIGLYNPAAGIFYLRDANVPGPADAAVRFGPAGRGWKPLMGDWDGV